MYQYYNYLIFEKNKEHFNDINPDLRKMTYKYDAEVKNAYMTVQASPEVIKAAMGMNVQQNQQKAEVEAKKTLDQEEGKESPPKVAPAANSDEPSTQLTLAKKGSTASKGPKTSASLYYKKEQILQIYRGLGDFKSPLSNPSRYGTKPENEQYLELLLNPEPNVVLQSMKELPPQEAHLGNKGKMISSIINSNISQTQ